MGGAAGTANVYQNAATGTNTNQSAISQTGTGIVSVYQGYDLVGTTPTVSGGATNYSGVSTAGSGNVNVYQSGGTSQTNVSYITQDASASNATVWQQASAANYNTSYISQTGGASTAYVHQH